MVRKCVDKSVKSKEIHLGKGMRHTTQFIHTNSGIFGIIFYKQDFMQMFMPHSSFTQTVEYLVLSSISKISCKCLCQIGSEFGQNILESVCMFWLAALIWSDMLLYCMCNTGSS